MTPTSPSNSDEFKKAVDLIFAASKGDVAEVKKLLDGTGLDPNIGDYDQRTPLHVASSEGQGEAVKTLLSFGASVNVVDRWNESPLDGATQYGHREVAAVLKSAGAIYGNVKAAAARLIRAVDEQDTEEVEKILSIGFDPNIGDYDNRTPLHIAVAVGNLEIAKLLIKNGADVHALDRFGGSPMSDAQAKAPRFGSDEMRDFLLKNGGQQFKDDQDDDNKIDFGRLVVTVQIIFLILFGIFVRYGDGAAGRNPVGSREEVGGKYAQFQDIHVMIFIGFGMLMLFLRKYAYSAISYNMMLSVIVIQWHILVNGFFYSVFEGDWKKIELSLTNFILADFACAAVLITFGACLGKVTKPSQLITIAILEIIFYAINEEIGKELHISDIGGSMVIHTFGAYFGLGVSYILTTQEARSHTDNSANYTSDVFSMVGTIFLWLFWPSFNSALAGPYDQERCVINTILALTASGTAAFASSYYLRGNKRFDMVDIQNASLAGGVAVGTTSNMMLGPVGAQVIGVLAGFLSVSGYVFIQPLLETKFGIFDTCGVHNLHGMPGVLAGIAGIIVTGLANVSRYNTEDNFDAVFPVFEDPGNQAGNQAKFLVITLAIASTSGLITGTIAKALCGKLQPRIYNDDKYFDKAFR